MEVERFEVDGVPVFAVATDGPVQSGLLFRVGTVDERPARRGLTHLVEHLAVHAARQADHPFNGATGPTFTSFYAEGTDSEVGNFIADVCVALHELPLDRFEAERRVLATEAMNLGSTVVSTLLALRYGVQGWGALELGEVGLEAVTAEDLLQWSNDWFTTQNAAAWVVAPNPRLVLRQLPLAGGEHRPPPGQDSVLARLPAWSTANIAGPGIGMVSRRSVALRWGMLIAARRADDQLRHRDAIVYGVVPTYDPMTADTCHVHIGADALEDHRDKVLPGLLEALDGVRIDGPTEAELARARRAVADGRAHTSARDRALAWAPSAAARLLEGAAPETPEEQDRLEDEVDSTSIKAALEKAWPTALAVVPYGCSAAPDPFTMVPQWSDPIATKRLRRLPTFRELSGAGTIAISEDELVLVSHPGHNRQVIVRSDRCPLVLASDDGSRVVYGADGFRVVVRPWLWDDATTLVRKIDAWADRANYITVGPGTGPPGRSRRRVPRKFHPELIAWFVAALCGLTVFSLYSTDEVSGDLSLAQARLLMVAMTVTAVVVALGAGWLRQRRYG